jgi:putative protein kinase ArgK-like GTPase of G3E family
MSSRTMDGIDGVWLTLQSFREVMIAEGEFDRRRQQQLKTWMWNYVNHRLFEVCIYINVVYTK